MLRYSLLVLFSFGASVWLAFYLSGRAIGLGDLEALLGRAATDALDVRQRAVGWEESDSSSLPSAHHVVAMEDLRSHDIKVACGMPATAPLKRKDAHPVYRWTDEKGQVHLSDRKPADDTVQRVDLDFPRDLDYFSLDISTVGFRSPPLIRGSLEVGMTKIFHVLSEFLEAEQLRKVTAKVQVHAQRGTFDALHARMAPDAAGSVQGFYESGSNMAVVLYDGTDVRTMNTAVHEATHIINAGLFGRTPRWFNEGLAEHFERIEVRGSAGIVPLAPEWLRVLSKPAARLPVRQLLTAARHEWREPRVQTYYANSWALMHFLLEPEHRPVAGALFRELAKDRCDELDAVGFFERHYPGGVSRLESELNEWLSAGRYIPHTY